MIYLWLLPSAGVSLSNILPPVAAGLLAGLHSHDAVPASGFLHLGGFHSDDCLGQGEAPQLPEGVPRLPPPPLPHPAIHLVEDCLGFP